MKRAIVYFSWSNNTRKLVEEINKTLNLDVYRVERLVPYSDDYNTCAYVEAKEEVDKKILPSIKEMNIDTSSYDEILLFFPIWWYTFPMPIGTFVKKYLKDFKGRVLIFANSYTNDPQYMVNSLRDLKELNNNVSFENALFNRTVKEHLEYLK